MCFPGGSSGKERTCNAGHVGLIPGSGRSPGGGHGSPLQCSCSENPKNRRAWRAAVYRVAESHDWSNWELMNAKWKRGRADGRDGQWGLLSCRCEIESVISDQTHLEPSFCLICFQCTQDLTHPHAWQNYV